MRWWPDANPMMTLTLAVEAGDGVGEDGEFRALRIFAAIVMLVVLALLATGERSYKLQRKRFIAPLLSGGWLALGVGVLLGPFGLQLIDNEAILEARPLILMGLGWIGVLVGMQAQRRIMAIVPRTVWRWVAIDTAAAVVVLGAVSWLVLLQWVENPSPAAMLAPIAMVVTAGLGWAAETRSIMTERTPERLELATFVRGGAGLSAMIAIVLFGLASKVVRRDELGASIMVPGEAAFSLVASAALAILVGLVGRFMLGQAGRQRSDRLVLFIGIVAVVTGVAAELGFSPLFSAMLAGAVIANLEGSPLRDFERFILNAEQAVGVIFSLLAGVLLDPYIGLWGFVLAGVIATWRLIAKTPAMRWSLREHAHRFPPGSALFFAPMRQAPVALALGVALVVAEASPFHRRLLAIVALVGLISEAAPLTRSWIARRRNGESSPPGAVNVATIEEPRSGAAGAATPLTAPNAENETENESASEGVGL